MNREKIILSLQRAFLGALDKDVRVILYDFSNHTLRLQVYFDRPTTEDDYDVIDIAATEILADFPELLSQHIELCEDQSPINELQKKGNLFFGRYEP